MVMGNSITGKDGIVYPMTGLLPISTSFQNPRLHLGYRKLRLNLNTPLGTAKTWLRAHEFHYAEETQRPRNRPSLFTSADALGTELGEQGTVDGSAFGSFMHLIDNEAG